MSRSTSQVYLYDPRLGGEEDSEKKILFFHPPSTSLREQVGCVGLCEAVSAFSNTFSLEGGESIHSAKGRRLAWQCEPNIWIVLFVPHEPPPVAKPSATTSAAAAAAAASKVLLGSSSSSSGSSGSGGGSSVGGGNGNGSGGDSGELPMHDEAMQDLTLRALLRRIYSVLRLSCGALSKFAEEQGADALRGLLAEVMPLLIRLLMPPADEGGRHLDLLDTVDGMRFLPVERRLYLRVQYALNLVLNAHPCVLHTMVLHGDQLVWSSLTREATQLVHRAATALVAPSILPPTKGGSSSGGNGRLDAEPPPLTSYDVAALGDEALLFAGALLQRQRASTKASTTKADVGVFVCGAHDPTQDGRSAVRLPCVHIEPQPGFGAGAGSAGAGGGGAGGDGGGGGGAGGDGGGGGSSSPPSADVSDGCGAAPAEEEAAPVLPGAAATAPVKHRLVVFQLQSMSLVLLVDDADVGTWSQPVWYQHLAGLLVSEMQPLASMLAEQHGRLQAVEEPHRFIYLNRLNLALKTSIRPMRTGIHGKLGLTSEARQLLNRLHSDLTTQGVREIALQTPGAHGWLVGHASESRAFYLLLEGRESSWSEVHHEVQSLCHVHFSNIYFTE